MSKNTNTKKDTKKVNKAVKPKSAPKKATKKVANKKDLNLEKKEETKVTETVTQPVETAPVTEEVKKEETSPVIEEAKPEAKVEAAPEEKKVEVAPLEGKTEVASNDKKEKKEKPHKERKVRESLIAISKPLRLVTQIALLLTFVLTLVILFVPLEGENFKGNGFLLALFSGSVTQPVIISTILVGVASVINLICVGLTISRQECKSYSAFVSLFVDAAIIIINIKSGILSIGTIIVAIAGILFSLGVIFLNLFPFIIGRKEKADFKPHLYVILSSSVFAILFATLFVPFNILGDNIFSETNVLFFALLNGVDLAKSAFIFGLIFLILLVVFAILFDNALKLYFVNHADYTAKSRKLTWLGIYISAAFFLAVIVIRIISNYTSSEKIAFNTIAYLPFALTSIIVVVQCYFIGKNEPLKEASKKVAKMKKNKEVLTEEEKTILKIRKNSIILVVVATILIGALIGSFFLKFLAIKTTDGRIDAGYSAYDLIIGFKNEAQSFTIVAYLFLVIGLGSIIFYVFTICALLSGAKSKTTLSKVLVIATYGSLIALSVTSVYFLASIRATPKILAAYFPDLPLAEYIADLLERVSITSQLVYPAIAVTVLMAVVLLLKPITNIEVESAKLAHDRILVGAGNGLGSDIKDKDEKEKKDEDEDEDKKKRGDEAEKVTLVDNVETFDNCPTFTEIDSKKGEFDTDYAGRKEQVFENPTLPKLVNYIVNYAQNSRLHLFYKKEDIATFLAGLASAKLSILQGMSGTGKTSLPKIFLEAVMGNCEIVEIESSWRDKNELLGYYNEFSRIYSPKKFTRALYKAKLNPSIVTFIVLDEMNLSRIEYYFSDFLSLMENEEDKREIRLLNNQIFNTYDNVRHPYLALKDNHTIMIPKNVWFIGTANRDESTFEISDKVYDRAYTMNFDHRAVAPEKFDDPMKPKFLEYSTLKKLFDEAPAVNFSVEENPTIKEVEKALRQYNISFGNRIARQIETFVRVYCNCFNKPEDIVDEAMETILLSKVVHKLEYKNVRNKEELIHTFKRLKLNRCVEFINKLEEEF